MALCSPNSLLNVTCLLVLVLSRYCTALYSHFNSYLMIGLFRDKDSDLTCSTCRSALSSHLCKGSRQVEGKDAQLEVYVNELGNLKGFLNHMFSDRGSPQKMN